MKNDERTVCALPCFLGLNLLAKEWVSYMACDCPKWEPSVPSQPQELRF